jgi:hypothetical protein
MSATSRFLPGGRFVAGTILHELRRDDRAGPEGNGLGGVILLPQGYKPAFPMDAH